MAVPCPLDVDVVERLVQRVACAEGKPVEVIRLSEGITIEGGHRCAECTTWYPSALAAAECADMDVADRLRRTRA